MKIDSSFGLPVKYTDWRSEQYQALNAILNSDRPVFLLDAPTGIGKSVLAIGIHRILKQSCIYLCRTKQLQNQIMQDFGDIAVQLKGRANYPCILKYEQFPEITADDCRYDRPSKCVEYLQCPYFCLKQEAKNSPLVVLNDAYFLNEVNGDYSSFGGRELMVVDECDSLDMSLMAYIQFTITTKQIDNFGLKLPEDSESKQGWIGWIPGVLNQLLSQINRYDMELTRVSPVNWDTPEIEKQRARKRLAKLYDKLQFLLDEVDNSWIFYSHDAKAGREFVFKPVQIGKYAKRYLWCHALHALGMSGTIFSPDITCADLGIESCDYMRLDSPFPVENRPIFFEPVCNLTFDTMKIELPKLRAYIDNTVLKYPSGKVLVHTTSYPVRDYLVENLRCHSRLMTHNSGDREKALIEFKMSKEPKIMLSPSFDRGVDLPVEDNVSCIIVGKMPFLSLGDPQVKARTKLPGGWQWYFLKAAQTLVQETGRSNRSLKQKCDIRIPDSQFRRLLSQTKDFIPAWWLKAVQNVPVSLSKTGTLI